MHHMVYYFFRQPLLRRSNPIGRRVVPRIGKSLAALRRRRCMRGFAHNMDNPSHPLNKAIVLVEALADHGVSPARALAGSGLRQEDLNDHRTRASTRQLLTIYRNALDLADDPLFAMKTGRRVHASHYGAFGFALVSSPTYRDALNCVSNYRLLSAPLHARDFHQDEATGNGVLTYRDYLGLDDDLCRFVLEFQIGCTRTLLFDIFGERFRFLAARLAYPNDEHAREREVLLDVPIEYGSPANQLLFDGYWLDCRLPYGHLPTAAMMHQICEQMLSSLGQTTSLALQVVAMLGEQPTCFPGIEEIANRLHMTSRTLRRKLQAEGTCYADILASVRKELAVHYLTHSQMKTETIAETLGFRDVANFRHAFRRWTNMTPSEFRRHGRAAPSS
jgi:AraC-like DNA-binding protein